MLRQRSIRFRLTIWYAAILSVSLGLFGGLVWFSLKSRLITESDRGLQDQASRFEEYFKAESSGLAGAQLRDELNEFCQGLSPDSFVAVRGTNGFTFQYPRKLPAAHFRVLNRQFRVGGDVFDLEVRSSVEGIAHTLSLLRLLLVSLIPAIIALACVGGAWLSGRALKPVQDITAAARNISIENLASRLPVPKTGDDVARLSEVLNRMLDRLETAVRTLSQFTGDASHELRTPLAVIRTTAELALRRPRSAEEYRDSLQEIFAETIRMTRLVEDLLLLARNDTGAAEMPLEALDVREIIEDVCAEMRGLAELRHIQVRQMSGEPAGTIAGNRPALHRLFLVLLDNALKYSDAGTTVNVRVTSGPAQVSISIENVGRGIDKSDLPHIFERFYRADKARSGEGFGLGLSLAQSIARAHGATIGVRSEPGASTVFEVSFPARGTAGEIPSANLKVTVIS